VSVTDSKVLLPLPERVEPALRVERARVFDRVRVPPPARAFGRFRVELPRRVAEPFRFCAELLLRVVDPLLDERLLDARVLERDPEGFDAPRRGDVLVWAMLFLLLLGIRSRIGYPRRGPTNPPDIFGEDAGIPFWWDAPRHVCRVELWEREARREVKRTND
jgi:hypothetical protein